MHTGQPSPQSIVNEYISAKTVLDTSKKNNFFPALNVSNNNATTDYDAQLKTKTDYTFNVQEPNTLQTTRELSRNQPLTILSISVQNPKVAFFLTGNRSNFLYVEGSTACLYGCPHYLSPTYKADSCFGRISIHYKDTSCM